MGKIKISELGKFEIVDYLDSDKAIAEYLAEVLAENDGEAFAMRSAKWLVRAA